MTTTGLSTSANSRRGINQTPAVATAIDARKRRRETRRDRLVLMAISFIESALDEREQVGVDRVCLRGRHAVWETLVGLQRPVL